MNLCIFRPIIFYGFLVSGFASFPDLEMEASSSANTTPKKVEFKKKVRVGMMEHTEHDEGKVFETKHVHSSAVCKQSLIIILERKNKKKRESAYNFVASINSMLYENGMPTEDPLIREAIKDRVLKIAKGIQGDFFVNRAVAQKEGSRPRLHILEENFKKITPETVEIMRDLGTFITQEDCLKIKEIARNNPSVIAALIALEQEKFDTIAQLNKRNISITADIFDAVSCRANTLTTDEIDLFLHFSV